MQTTLENWTHTHYEKGDLMAQITMGAAPSSDDSVQIFYYVTVLQKTEGPEDFREMFQQRFGQLEEAIELINKKYREWQFIDRTVASDNESGCGSCSAH